MIIGVLSDTHGDKAKATPHIIREFKQRGVEAVIHCGDIEVGDLDPDLYGNFPVFCALVDDQCTNDQFKEPEGWEFTKSDDRVRRLTPKTPKPRLNENNKMSVLKPKKFAKFLK